MSDLEIRTDELSQHKAHVAQLGLTTEDFNSQEADLTRGFKAEVNVWGKRGRHE